ncbi:hypothetical protein AAVH_10454 [Aphelenchoides avenae]|nr:hypothetical protein AAVH_10454 [Aphelenchus avenae]
MECTRVEAECAQREAEYSEVQRREDQLSDELDHLATSLSMHQHPHQSEPPFHQSSMALSPEKSSESPGTSGQSEAAEVEDDTLRQQLARILGHDPVDTQQFEGPSGQLETTEEDDVKFLSGQHMQTSSNDTNVTECYVDSSPVFNGYTLRDALEHSPSLPASNLRKRITMPSNATDSPKKRKWGRLNGITLDELRGHAARMNQWWDRKTKRFRCPVCNNASVKSRDKAIRHVLDHFDDKTYFPYQCPVEDCSYLSIRMDHVIAHYRGTHKKQEWNDHLRTCSIIVENKVIIDALFEDTKATVPQARCLPYKCPLDGCNYISDQLEYVRAHVTGLHKLDWSDAMVS